MSGVLRFDTASWPAGQLDVWLLTLNHLSGFTAYFSHDYQVVYSSCHRYSALRLSKDPLRMPGPSSLFAKKA